MSLQRFVAVLSILSLSACGWVDSTGKQDVELPALIDPSLVVLRDGDAFQINENTQKTVVFSNADNRVANWSWSRLDGQADIQRCSQFANFEQFNALNSLPESCATNNACNVDVEETNINDITQFQLTTPQLRAPAALEYKFTARTNDGINLERYQLVCAIPINDAPIAHDDPYNAIRGTTLTVDGDSTNSLLANDEDDQDIRNKPLQVITTAETEPRFADVFELYADGGFIYKPSPNAPISSDGSISDRFTYQVTDGTSTNSATATISIINFNTAPVQTAELPEIDSYIVDDSDDSTYADFAAYFNDAENDALLFSAVESTLPESNNLYLSSDGQLRGNPASFDSGRYFVKIQASDAIESVEAGFYLNVVRTNGVNKAPYADDISNATVRGDFKYDITPFFKDADNDNMSFTATGLPSGVTISPDGIISGTVDDNNSGRVLIRVFANDGNGGINSDGFRLTLR